MPYLKSRIHLAPLSSLKHCAIAFALTCIAPMSIHAQNWVGTWATAPEYTGENDMPRKTTLTGNALRQTIHTSLGGETIRLKLSNEFSDAPVEIKDIYISQPTDSSAIDASKATYLKFDGKRSVTIPPHGYVYSDPVDYHITPLQLLSVTTNYGSQTPPHATSHRGSRTTSFIMEGESKPKKPFKTSERLEHWYNIASLEVLRDDSPECIAVIGNSITDGRGSTTDHQNRWTDVCAESLGGNVGILNLGIGGNCVLSGGISQPAVKRFDRDIMGQNGITAIVVYEGINDIGGSRNAEQTAQNLIKAYESFIEQGHAKGLKVYGGTITQIGHTDYWSHIHEGVRQTVNEWIRTSGKFDGVIDFDAIIADPQKPTQMNPAYQFDGLHPNAEGYKAMGQAAARVLGSDR